MTLLALIRTPDALYIFWPVRPRGKNMRRHPRAPEPLARAS